MVRISLTLCIIVFLATHSFAIPFHKAKLEEAKSSFEGNLIDLAIRQYKEVLELAKGAEIEDMDCGRAYVGLAECSLKKRRPQEAIASMKKALQIFDRYEQMPKEEYEKVLDRLIPTANEDDDKKSLEMALNKWMTLINERGDRKDQHLGHKIFNYGMILADNDYFGKAESMLLQSLKLFRRYLGEEHRWVVQVHGHLADTYMDAKNFDLAKAEEHTVRQIEMIEKKHDIYSMHLVRPLKRFAAIRREQSEYGPSAPPDARSLYLRTIDIIQSSEGKKTIELVALYYELASVCFNLNQIEKAKQYAQKGSLIGEQLEDKDKRPAALPSLHLLVRIARNSGNKNEADYLEDKMVTIYLESAKIYPVDITAWFVDIANNLIARNELELAVKLLRKTANRFRNRLGPSSEKAIKADERADEIEATLKKRKDD